MSEPTIEVKSPDREHSVYLRPAAYTALSYYVELSPAARWHGAVGLVAEHDQLDPMPAYVPVVEDANDTCRHGRLFSAPCRDCEI